MAVLTGNLADIYAVAGAGTAMLDEACTLTTGNSYQINDTVKRVWDKTTAFAVKVGGVVTTIPYQLSYASGTVNFISAPGGAVTVTGAFLTITQLGQSNKWSLNIEQNRVMTATFGDLWEEFTTTTRKASATLGRFYNDNYFLTNNGAPIALYLYTKQSLGERYMLIGRITNSVTSEESSVMMESLSVTADGPVDYSAT